MLTGAFAPREINIKKKKRKKRGPDGVYTDLFRKYPRCCWPLILHHSSKQQRTTHDPLRHWSGSWTAALLLKLRDFLPAISLSLSLSWGLFYRVRHLFFFSSLATTRPQFTKKNLAHNKKNNNNNFCFWMLLVCSGIPDWCQCSLVYVPYGPVQSK